MQAASSGRIEQIRAKIVVLDPEADEPPLASDESDTAATPTGRKEAAGS